jgi:predicted transcriptional regulator
MEQIEVSHIDTGYESLRLRDKNREKVLLESIIMHGVNDPLKCIFKGDDKFILLDGFKRLRCCKMIKMSVVPVSCLGNDEVSAMLHLIRLSNANNLNILEQAAFVDELHQKHRLSVKEIARQVECSPAWVSVRLGILHEMSDVVREALFSGAFPVRSYMYTLRQFTRVNKTSKQDIDEFVKAVSGKNLSTRNIETLSYGYFRGGEKIRRQIEKGNIPWTLKQMCRINTLTEAEKRLLNETELKTIRELEILQKYINKTAINIKSPELGSESFFNTAGLLIKGILSKIDDFKKNLQEFYNGTGKQKTSHKDAL